MEVFADDRFQTCAAFSLLNEVLVVTGTCDLPDMYALGPQALRIMVKEWDIFVITQV